MLEELLSSVEEKHKQRPISPEAYNKWRVNGVTRRLMEEIELNLIEMLTADVNVNTGDDAINYHGICGISKQSYKDALGTILNWKPVELEKDDD